MRHYLLVLSYIFSVTYFIGQVAALSKETIIGGIPVPGLINFQYQAIVRAIENNSYEFKLMGGAAILSHYFAISAANIFLEETGELKEKSFSLLVGSRNLNNSLAYPVEISRIFVPVFDSSFILHNLAVIELAGFVFLGGYSLVNAVRLPDPSHQFQNTNAVISGFGYYKAATKVFAGIRVVDVNRAALSPMLRYSIVHILKDAQCQAWYSADVMAFNMCGTVKPRPNISLTGVCFGDIGGPLVIADDLLIGILSSTTLDCDNTRIGALYVKVMPHVNAIHAFMNDLLPDNAFIRHNRLHVVPAVDNVVI